MQVRYIADWVNDMDDMGEGDYDKSFHGTYDAALENAIKQSKRAGAIEWVRVREQHYDQKTARWQTVKKWTGDYEAVEEST